MAASKRNPRRKLALAQCAPKLGNLPSNLQLHLDLADRAAAEGATLCVFPELSLTGYFLKDLVPEMAMELDDARLEPLLEASRRIDLVLGMVVKSADFRYYNAAVYLAEGEVRHVHRKVYLPTYGMFDESRYFAAGDRVRTFDRHGFGVGALVCEDAWHLSAPYLLFVQGVSLMLCISSSPGRGVLANPEADLSPGSAHSWEDLLRTVAEYTASYVVYCNRVGYEDGVNFWGGSAVLAPDGSTVAEAGAEEGMLFADIDLREVERQRLNTPLLRDEKVEFTLRELERVWNERTGGPY
ncbi:MAG TPA: nitrilase-related carbon-nitrogen hydrolase [Candidatus Dormibacteraeota bacterium]|jgi:predicted amidohydrolase|nr:nitrilase-related carbon-nitrogen hydrolase [Candidatus Dormibacteraeota bacterium]